MEKYYGDSSNPANKVEDLNTYEIDENEFDVEQYKKDIQELNRLTSKILNNNPSCVTGYKRDSWDGSLTEINYSTGIKKIIPGEKSHDIPFPHPIKQGNITEDPFNQKNIPTIPQQLHVNRFAAEYVGKKLTDDIMEVSKEKLEMDMPPIARDLAKLGLYGVYTVSDNKFDAAYLDFVQENNNDAIPTVAVRLFNSVGRMKERLIPLDERDSIGRNSIEIGIKDFINDDFVRAIKDLISKNTDVDFPSHFSKPIVLTGNENNDNYMTYISDVYSKICRRIQSISNQIFNKNKRGPATFIFASKANIDLIIEAFGGFWYRDGKTYKYNRSSDEFRFDFVANNELGNTVIIGRKPEEMEVGINLVINKNTLTNFQCDVDDDDVTGVNLSFNFFAFGSHPEWNYFSFDLER